MSDIYVSEPMTHGKVVLNTTIGPLDIELWSKQAPKACRNFVQLCMEGYYNKCQIFRIIKDFIAQTGDPTNTGEGGESIYEGGYFNDEFHSRLRFARRGLVACASFEKNHNGSQFFFTLDKTPELNRKHTIFGKVAGDTVFNLLRLNEFITDSNDRPESPPIILNAEVVWNPFDDIVPRVLPQMMNEDIQVEKNTSETKAVKNLSLLSFGEDEQEEDWISEDVFKKTKNLIPKKKNIRKKKIMEEEEHVNEDKKDIIEGKEDIIEDKSSLEHDSSINSQSKDDVKNNKDSKPSKGSKLTKESQPSEDIFLSEHDWEKKMKEKASAWKHVEQKMEDYEKKKGKELKKRRRRNDQFADEFDEDEDEDEENDVEVVTSSKLKRKGLFAEPKEKDKKETSSSKKKLKMEEADIMKKFELFEQSLKTPAPKESWKSHVLKFEKEAS